MKHIIAVVLILACSLPLLGQNARFSMEEGPYYKNCPFNCQLVLENSKPDAPPEMKATADFAVQTLPPQSSSNSSVTIINGKINKTETVSTVYTFRLTPLKTGTLTLPPCTVVLNGKQQTTSADTIQVETLNTNSKLKLTARPDKTICALGEPITVSYLLTSRASIQNYELNMPILELENMDITPVPLTEQQENSRAATLLTAANGTKLPALQSSSSSQLAIRFAITIVPRKPGRIVIPSASLVGMVQDPTKPIRRNRNSFFDDPFFGSPFGQRYATVRCAASSDELTIVVKEPPETNRPASYNGLAEACTISATADKTDVYVGDPIVLSITIRGPKFPNSIRCPKLSQNPAFNNAFRVFDNDAPGVVNADSSITFQRTIRATATDVTAIPPVEIAWFDAAANDYKISATSPIAITVKATKKATAIAAGIDTTAQITKIDIAESASGIKGNFPPDDCLANQSAAAISQNAMTMPWLLIGMPLATLAVALIRALIRHRSAHADYYRARGAAAKAIRLLAKADDATAFQTAINAICLFAADKLQRNADAFTWQDVKDFLTARHCDDALLRKTEDIFRTCEGAIYSGKHAIAPAQILEDTRHILADLEKAIG